ncbi:MAG: hypothetical protein HY534_02655 [Chloroflexi bacterium]|nr:hypothetical protein [Chloroflexota bacterium]
MSFWISGSQLFEGSGTGLDLREGDLVLGADARYSPAYDPHSKFGTAQSLAVQFDWPSVVDDLILDAELPRGTDVLLEARGWFEGHWGLWELTDALDALAGASSLQARVTLLSSPSGQSPRVRGVYGWVRPMEARFHAENLAAQFGPPTATLWATREGLVGGTTANGHVIVERDRFVALPSRRALNALDRSDYVVRLEYRGRTVEAPVWDVGPWNIRDDYWNERRESFGDLPRWTPAAEAAFFRDYNGGRDEFGRYVTIPTSIDLADGTFWDDLQMTSNDWIRVTFLWLDAASPPARTTPLVTPRSAPASESGAPIILAPPPPAASGSATLAASPNPVPAGSGRGITNISWNTGDGSFGQVFVWQQGGGEVPFGQGAKGSAEASWITPGWTYEFRLYQGMTKAKRLRTLTVTGSHSRQTAIPTPAPALPPWNTGGEGIPAPGSPSDGSTYAMLFDPPWIAAAPDGAGGSLVSWSTGNGGVGQVFVWQPGGSEVPFSQGSNGFASISWLRPGWAYEFRLYQGLTRLQTLRVVGHPQSPIRVPASDSTRASLTARVAPALDADDPTVLSITWDTGTGLTGQLYVSEGQGPEELYAQGPVGTRDVPGLTPGDTYYFSLYEGTGHVQELAAVSVTAPTAEPPTDLADF